jgi:hypothetical protein
VLSFGQIANGNVNNTAEDFDGVVKTWKSSCVGCTFSTAENGSGVAAGLEEAKWFAPK